MRTIKIISVLTLVLLFAQCKKEDPKPVGYLKINGETYDLKHGIIDDDGTNEDLTYRIYDLEFSSSDTENPPAYFNLTVYSNSTERLQEGTYKYNYIGYQDGEFSFLKVGYNLKYDDTGTATSGNRISENTATTGSCKISKKDDNYLFEISGTFTKDGTVYNYEIYFNEALVGGYLYK